MENLKKRVVQEIISLGKKDRRLRMPALALVAGFLVIYHAVRDFFLQFRYHPVRQRLLVGILIMALLAGEIGIANVFAETGSKTEITAFAELPDEIRNQTVGIGTNKEELVLPETLEAVVPVETEEPKETESQAPAESPEGTESPAPAESQEETESQAPAESQEETESPAPAESQEETESPAPAESPEETESQAPAESPEETESPAPAESPEAAESDDQTEALQAETSIVSMPEYYASPQDLTADVLTKKETQTKTITIEGVVWQSAPAYDSGTAGEYLFTPVLPEGYVFAEGVSLPQITVTVIDGEQASAPRISGWHFNEEAVAPKGDLLYKAGSYSLVLAGGDSRVQIPFEDIISVFPQSVTVEYTYPYAGADVTDNTGTDTLEQQEVLSILGWSCPEYTEDEEGNLPYRGSFFFTALLGEDGEEKEYALSEDVEPVGVWMVFDEPMLLDAVTAVPGTITSDQEWGEQTLTAGTYTINPGVTVTVSGKLTVSGEVTITGGGKLVRSGSYTGTDDSVGDNNTLLYVSGGSLTLENITVDGNQVVAYGPAVYISSGTVDMKSNAVIQNNYNMNSGNTGIYAGGGVYCAGTLNIDGGIIQNCRTTGAVGNYVYTHAGGGIYLKGTCNINSGSISGNSASNGGGIYLASGAELNLTGGTISGNAASGEGDGIYYSTVNNSNGKLNIGGDTNVADIIFLDITSGTLYPIITSALRYQITLKCNSREEGRVLAKGSGYTLTGVDASKITMVNSNLYSKLDKENNQILLSTTEEAEAEWQESAGGEWKSGKFTTALSDVYSGGTIRLLTDIVFTEKVEIAKTVTITSKDPASPCTVTRMPAGDFGNITLTGSGNLTLTNIIYDGNRDYISGNGASQSLIKIGDNKDDTGTALMLGNGCTICNGYKSGGSGVIAVYGSMTMDTGAVIENCEVTGTGGAVWISSSGSFTMNGGAIQNCKAGDGGSAISADGNCILNGGSITGNTDASAKDCTVYLRSSGSGSLTLNGITVSGNTYSVYNEGQNVSVAGDSALSGSIYSTNAVTAREKGVSSLTKTYTIRMSSVTEGDTVVTGSADTQHYQLVNSGYVLCPGSGAVKLIAAGVYTVTYNTNGGTIADESSYTSYTWGTGLTLPTPVRTGYTFGGWYTSPAFKGAAVTSITSTDTGAKTYHAYWKDETAPHAPVLQAGVTLPADWTKTQNTIPLTLYDGVAVTELWVSIDGGPYEKADGFPSGSTQYFYTVTEGNHTYRFKAKDAAGNTSEASSAFTVKLDTVGPVIGELTYEYKTADLWQWIIGKKSMIIHVPIADAGSGVTQISYTMIPLDAAGNPDNSKSQIRTAAVEDNEAKLTFSESFRGRIVIHCTDAAGNAASSVTISADGGIIAEDHAPEISFAVNGGEASENYYDTAPVVSVSVTDEKADTNGGVITGGIASVTYQIGGGTQKSDGNDYTVSMVTNSSFSIPANDIPAGETLITVTATDNAGNTATKSMTVRVKVQEETPNAAISYTDEVLKGFMPGGEYEVSYTGEGGEKQTEKCTADADGSIKLREEWIGKTLEIVKTGNGIDKADSAPQRIMIPERQETDLPSISVKGETGNNKGDGKLTGLIPGMTYQISADGGASWQDVTADEDAEIKNLPPGTYEVRVKAADDAFCSASVTIQVPEYVCKHVWDYGCVTKEPTASQAGTRVYTCIVCGETKAEAIPAKGGVAEGPAGENDVSGENDNDTGNDAGDESRNPHGGSGTQRREPASEATDTEAASEDKDTVSETAPEEDQPVSLPGKEDARTALYTVEDGRIVPQQEMPVGGDNKTVVLAAENGAVIVTVNNIDEALCAAQAADAANVANAVLTKEEIMQVAEGETIEIRIDVERIDDVVPQADKDLIGQGMEDCRNELPGLTMGIYVDISIFMRIGEGEWNAVRATKEPVEIVIDVPKELQALSADFYILRAHAGECLLLKDLDDAEDTITIRTELFSTYAITYQKKEAGTDSGKCGLCHICPTFLGICCFIWLAILAAAALVIVMVILHRKKTKAGKGQRDFE